jgi:hypothetical protein
MTTSLAPRSEEASTWGNLVGITLLVLLGGSALLLFSERFEPMPPHAKVVVDEQSRTYFAPPYFSDNRVPQPRKARIITAGEVRNYGYTPDKECRDQGYFKQELGALIWQPFRTSRSRWNADGS